MNRTVRMVGILPWLPLAVVAAGCRVPAGVSWAPGGAASAYQVDDRAVVIDREGRVLADLGEGVAGSCWSADGKKLYVATLERDDGAAALTTVRREWLPHASATPGAEPGVSMLEDPSPAKRAGSNPRAEYVRLLVSVRSDGKTTPLFRVRSPFTAARLLVSPDGSWLVLGTSVGNFRVPGLPMPDLYAYSLRSGRLFGVSPWCSSACFTGPNRLAFVRCTAVPDFIGLHGTLFEATLAEDQKPSTDGPPNTTALLELMPFRTGSVQALGEDVLFTASPHEFPRPLRKGQLDETVPYQLYRWSRETGRLTAVADNAGPWFLASPGGRKVLFDTSAAKEDDARTLLAVINADGAARANLHVGGVPVDDRHFAFDAMEPAWRDEDHIVLAGPAAEAPPPAANDDDRTRYDVTLYRLGPDGKLERVQNLSRDWDPKVKPYTELLWRVARPATQPTSEQSGRPTP